MIEFRMPSLGADMDKGVISAWHIKPGDTVKKGDIVADVETDKGTIEVEIWQPGKVKEILVEPGREVPVGTPVAILSSDMELEENSADLTLNQARPEPEKSAQRVQILPAAPVEPPSEEDKSQKAVEPKSSQHQHVSPLARKVAKDLGVDLQLVIGTGPHGAITRGDVEKTAKKNTGQLPLEHIPQHATKKSDAAILRRRDLGMRKAIGQAMARSKREIPHYYLKTEVNMARALDWLTQHNAKVSVSKRLLPIALELKATAHAARKYPEFNGHFVDGTYHPNTDVHLGVAISLRGGGLVAPAVAQANQKSLDVLMTDLLALINRARTGKLRSSEVSEQTITVTNLGDTGVDTVFGVIYPPQVAMVGFGRIIEKPWAEHGMVGACPILTVTLSADHRVSDGHRGALFLGEIGRRLQDPESL